ncbi:MAG: PAS domain-containing protein [Deltaproteobacteria bacterium]|jgi:rsbT co-antagonist protein RsbR|nr:PAS domain-containing protein [Deltaproteobacteria bacterium]
MENISDYKNDEGFLFEIINAVPSGIFVTDLEHNILLLNKSAASIVGKTPGECFDRKCNEIFDTKMCGTEKCACLIATETDEVCHGQTVLHHNGKDIPIEYAARPLKNHEGKIVGCVEHFVDISERLEREQLIQKQQEELLRRQEENIRHLQDEVLELSTPVIELWEGVLALPLIGTLDSHRARMAMERLLETIEKTRAPFIIIDITGVPTVDTEVANRLLQTVDATRLMGSEAILTGISPHIALTMAHLGVNMTTITVRSRMSDALHLALMEIQKRKADMNVLKNGDILKD